MQYENVFKSDRCCSCYTCLPQTVPAAQTAQKMVAGPGTGTGAPPVAQRLLTIATPKQVQSFVKDPEPICCICRIQFTARETE